MSKLRKIKILCSKKQYEVNVDKVVYAHVLGRDGKLDKVPNYYFDKDPRGNWVFIPKGWDNKTGQRGWSEFTLEETFDWENRTPSEVDPEINIRSPGLTHKYGPDVPYVSLEEALMAFLKQMKGYIRGRLFSLVCTPEVADVVSLLVDNGWPLEAVENVELLHSANKIEKSEQPNEAEVKVPVAKKTSPAKKNARDMVKEAKAKKAANPEKTEDKELIEA